MILQVIVNSLITGSIYATIAFGFTLMYGTMNFFNMGYGANVMLGAYAFYIFYQLCGIPLLLSALLACIVTAGLMLLVDRVCYHGFRQKRVPSWTSVAVSMAIATLATAIITMIFGSSKVQVYGGLPQSFELTPDVHATSVQIVSFVVALLLMAACTLFLRKTKTGTRIRAISNDKWMAKVVGIDVEKVYIIVIALGSVLATVAGILLSMDTDLRPTISSTALLKAIVASIVGGVGNIRGALFAGLLIGFIENFAILFIGSGWRDAIPLVLIVLFMLLKPSVFGIEEKA